MSKTTPEEAKALELTFNRVMNGAISMGWISDVEAQQLRVIFIDEVRGVDAEPYAYEWLTPNTNGTWYANFGFVPPKSGVGYKNVKPLYTHPAPSQPAAMVNLAAETPTQNGARATLAVQGLSKAFDGLGSGRKDRKMKVTDEMVNRFLMWKLPAGFAPDCGISFKSESDYEHPVFGRSKHEPMGTNLFSADQARAMLEHVLADIQPAAPVELPVVNQLDRLQTNMELSFDHGDEGDEGFWCVHQVHGGVNDREWTLIGKGRTIGEAVDAAIAAGRKPS